MAIAVRAPQSQLWPRAGAPPSSPVRLPMIGRRGLHPSFTVEQFFRFSSLKFSPNKSTNEISIVVWLGPCYMHYWKRDLCRVQNALPSVKNRALGKDFLCRVPHSAKNCTRQRVLCRVPDTRQKKALGKSTALGIGCPA